MLSLIFQIEEVNELVANFIDELKSSKAKDANGLDTKICKRLFSNLNYNLSFRQAVVPSAWKVATVIPIYKSGDKSNWSNYRPISILLIISTVAEKAKLLTNHLNNGFTANAIWIS